MKVDFRKRLVDDCDFAIESQPQPQVIVLRREQPLIKPTRLRDQLVALKSQFEGTSQDDVLKELKKTARKGSAFGNRKNAAYGSARRS